MDAKIRVKTGIEVEVNDAGECIIIPVEDAVFVQKMQEMSNKLVAVRNRYAQRMQGKSQSESIKIIMDASKEIMTEIDDLFGEDSCRKIFGDTIPSIFAIGEFMNQIIPIAERYAEDRMKRMNEKYGKRQGNNKPYRNKRR